MADETSKGIKNQVVGAAKEVAGTVRDAAADLTGDMKEQVKGKRRRWKERFSRPSAASRKKLDTRKTKTDLKRR